MAQEKKTRTAPAAQQDDTVQDAPVAQDTTLVDETDALLDEIDAVLESDAEQFVRQYVQKGGQ